jgi:glycosyltransferase involved in cell wall biosynthesis
MEKLAMPDKPVANISLVVPNHNNGRYLAAFFNSVLESTCYPAELILVDDGSTDLSMEVINTFHWLPFLKVLPLEKNCGISTALNEGLKYASGKYIMRADPDDCLHPERIERQYRFMESNPEVEVSGCNVYYFHHSTGRNINRSNFPLQHDAIVKTYRKGMNGIQHPTAIFRRAAIEGCWYRTMDAGEDYDFFATMAKNGFRFSNLPESLYRMRVHPSSLTSNLGLAGVKAIFEARDRIWQTNTPALKILTYFFYIYFYRKSQLSENILKRFLLLILASCFFPERFIKRFISA